jgi:hypothetical protein
VTRIFPYLMTAILSVGFTLIGEGAMRAPKISADNAAQLTNAAYRDGNYMAKLDLENGHQRHLSLGRWSADQDRALYVLGYQQVYPSPLSSESVHDQNALTRFQLARNETFRSSDGCLSGGNQ